MLVDLTRHATPPFKNLSPLICHELHTVKKTENLYIGIINAADYY